MPHGRNTRRVLLGRVGIVLTMALFAGCQRASVQRIDPLPVLPNTAPGPPKTVATTRPEPKPLPQAAPIPLLPPTPPPPPPPPATPLLDAIKSRAEDVKRVNLELPNEPNSPSPPIVLPNRPDLPEKVVSEGPPPPPASKPDPPPTPRDVWRDGLAELRTFARDRAAASDEWSLRARLLDWMEEPHPDDETPQLRRAVLTVLAPSSTAADVRAAVETLEERAPLAINELRLCRKVSGFGNFEPIDPAASKAGRAVIVYCEMTGIRSEAVPDGMSRSRLSARIEVVLPGVDKPVWTEDLGTADDLCRRRRRDYFVNYAITLPKTLAPDRYELRLTQTDELAGQTATLTIPLVIAP